MQAPSHPCWAAIAGRLLACIGPGIETDLHDGPVGRRNGWPVRPGVPPRRAVVRAGRGSDKKPRHARTTGHETPPRHFGGWPRNRHTSAEKCERDGISGSAVQDDDGFRQFKEPELAKELTVRVASDQAARQEIIDFTVRHKLIGNVNLAKVDPKIAAEYTALIVKVQSEDRKNVLWLKDVVSRHGWPGKSLVGSKSAHSAWLLVQHADSDREFQQTCLTTMEALPEGEVEARDIAYLTDRILVGCGKKQKYGTQTNFKDGKAVAAPIDDEDHVDERRKALGLEPLEEYLKLIEEIYTKPQKPESERGGDGKP